MSTACRLCGHAELVSVLDLGASPPCEAFLPSESLDLPEATYPLHLRLCPECRLLQIPALIQPDETFTDYAYYSSFSTSWVDHAKRFVDASVASLGLGPDSFVVEVASNDGYLLQHVVAQGIRCLGIEPSVNVGAAALAKGVPTVTAFLDEELGTTIAAEHGKADLVVANNVWAHIPDIIGFTRGLRALVADTGRVSIEVHHALSLVTKAQFDTIYHEHFQYWTVLAATGALERGGLSLVDVELLETHGGSIRLWAAPTEAGSRPDVARRRGRRHRVRGRSGHRRRLPRAGNGDVAGAGRPRRVPHRGPPIRPPRRRLRGPGQGEHSAQLLRHPARPRRVPRRPQPVQAWPVHAWRSHPGRTT
jgi:hypothetical protein